MTEDICGAITSDGDKCTFSPKHADGKCGHHTDETDTYSDRDSKLTKQRQEEIAQAIEQGKSLTSASRMAGIDRTTVYNWLEKGEDQQEGVYAEFFDRFNEVWYDDYNHQEHMKMVKSNYYSGEDSAHWNGGGRNYRGPNWHEQRKKALERDRYSCQSCGMHDKEHREKYDYGLHVHHIVARCNFSDDDPEQNVLDNLITLCHQCHEMYEGTNLSPVEVNV